MKRWIFNILPALSLALCLAVAGLWVADRSGMYDWSLHLLQDVEVWSMDGDLFVGNYDPALGWPRRSFSTHFMVGSYETTAIEDMNGAVVDKNYDRYLVIHDWFLLILFGLLPGVWLFRWAILRQRVPKGCCRACGYDLRASKGACPECGEAIPIPLNEPRP